jgi:uncharacterized protein YbcI
METAQLEIAREIERVHDEAYGGALSNINVQVNDNLVVVVMDVEFNRAEQTLVDAGNADSVRATREAFQDAIAPTFKAIVERATGRTVESFASRMIMEPPWSAEIFRLAPSPEG